MRTTIAGAILTLACFGTHPAHAQNLEYTDAVSRQIVLMNNPSPQFTDAISRQIQLVNPNTNVVYADAISRQVLLYEPPYVTEEATMALRLAAGLLQATRANMNRLDIIRDGESAERIDVRDVVRIVRMAAGLGQ